MVRVRAIFWGYLLVAAGSSLGAAEKMTIKVSPAVAFAPADLRVLASVEASADNRALEVAVESPEFYRSSTIELTGESAPRTTVFELRNIPGGAYEVSARLFGPAGVTRAFTRQSVKVIPRDASR
jgi:hypothetical protein